MELLSIVMELGAEKTQDNEVKECESIKNNHEAVIPDDARKGLGGFTTVEVKVVNGCGGMGRVEF